MLVFLMMRFQMTIRLPPLQMWRPLHDDSRGRDAGPRSGIASVTFLQAGTRSHRQIYDDFFFAVKISLK